MLNKAKDLFKKLGLYTFLFLSGALFTLAFAPFYYFFVGFAAFPVLYWAIVNAPSRRKAFIRAYVWAMGHHITGLYWVAYSLLVEADKFAWLVPFAVLLIPAYLSIYIGVIAVITHNLKVKFYSRILYFAGLWMFAEIARNYIFTGFPWNLSGMVFLAKPELASLASIFGVFGLSFFAVLFFTSPYLFFENFQNYRKGSPDVKYGLSYVALFPVLAFLVFSGIWGNSRMKAEFHDTDIRLIQPNIPQGEKFSDEAFENNYKKLIELSFDKDTATKPDTIIWPEAALPVYLRRDYWFVEDMQRMLKNYSPNSNLLLGTIRLDDSKGKIDAYNSFEIISAKNGVEPENYDKSHLVPFGEYIPFRRFLPNVEKITYGMGDFGSGEGNKTLATGNLPPFMTLICYEIIFTERVGGHQLNSLHTKPQWILNITNDAWFGDSTGPRQHLDTARMRAIESGLPVIRVANTGITAVIDAYGRVLESIPLNRVGAIDTKLPKPAEATVYSHYGLKLPLIAIFALLAYIRLKARLKQLTKF